MSHLRLPLTLFLCLSFLLPAYSAPEEQSIETKLLEKIQKDTFQYFLRVRGKKTGLIRDSSRPGMPASIAATGFGLAAFAIAADHGWIDDDYARERIRQILDTALKKAEHEKGFFYHFLDPESGKRSWSSEASSIDTALFLAGALLAGEYFPGTDIQKMAGQLYERVDWRWMMNGSDLICMGWTPEGSFLPYYWDTYNELIILQALALGSPTHPVPPAAWNAWLRNEDEYSGHRVVYSYSGSLFTYQYSHAFIDFRHLDDRGINYFDNSIEATLANRDYSQSFQAQSKSYHDLSWGLSASVGPAGYQAYGGKPGQGLQDGTIAPHAAIGSIVFTPEESLRAIKYFYKELGPKIYGDFGFKGSFNLDKKYYSDEYLGIDQGIIFLMLENHLNDGAVWKKFMSLELVQKWIRVAGLKNSAPLLFEKEKNDLSEISVEIESEETLALPSGDTEPVKIAKLI